VTHQVEVALQDDDAAQGKNATATFVRDAQNT
jgi:hypothetical protein